MWCDDFRFCFKDFLLKQKLKMTFQSTFDNHEKRWSDDDFHSFIFRHHNNEWARVEQQFTTFVYMWVGVELLPGLMHNEWFCQGHKIRSCAVVDCFERMFPTQISVTIQQATQHSRIFNNLFTYLYDSDWFSKLINESTNSHFNYLIQRKYVIWNDFPFWQLIVFVRRTWKRFQCVDVVRTLVFRKQKKLFLLHDIL